MLTIQLSHILIHLYLSFINKCTCKHLFLLEVALFTVQVQMTVLKPVYNNTIIVYYTHTLTKYYLMQVVCCDNL